jgi:NAD(P)-dependent dehydrogenase (short-subunit alcohol dehydrogenase family)
MDRDGLRRLFDLGDRVVLVTGGTRGIGLALAEGFLAAGASVVVASRKEEACREAAEHLTAMGGTALGVPAHLGRLEDLDRLVDTVTATFGRLDVVVNNAANALALPIGAITPEAWTKSFDVNLRGPVFLVQRALPALAESPHAAVLNVVSIGAFLFSGGLSLYAAGKAALLSYTRTMAAELAPRGVRVNALAPGSVDTDMTRNNPPEAVERMAQASLQRRLAAPGEMVGPALFLVSDAGSFVTGQVVVADGGTVPY